MLPLNAVALAAAVAFALASGAGVRTSHLCLATLAGYLLIVHSSVLLMGLAGHLSLYALAIVVTGTLLVATWLAEFPRAHGSLEPPESRAPVNAVALFSPLAAAAALLAWMWPHLFDATRLWVWDDYTYHMVYPALWLREHTIAAPDPSHAFTMQAWYPLSASVIATWFMLPYAALRAEALAWVSLTGPLYAGLFVAGVAELFARLRCHPGAWAVPVVLFATSSRTAIMASSFSDADLAQASAIFAALVFAVPRANTEERTDVVDDTWYAALLTGFAIGVKVSAAPAALIVLAMMILRARGRAPTGRRRLVTTASIFAVSWVVTAGYWYARNLIDTGNPVYPAAFLFWSGTTFPETTLREYAGHYGLPRALADALDVYLTWPATHVTLAALGLAGLVGGLAFRRRTMARPARYFAWGALALAAAILVLLPSLPYSAGNAMTFRSGFIHWDSMRYVALLPLIGWAALGFVIDGGAGARPWRLLVAVLISVGVLLTSNDARLAAPVTVIGLAVAAGLLPLVIHHPLRRRVVASRWWPRQGPLLVVSLGALTLGVVVAISHDAKTAATATAIHSDPFFGAAARVLDEQPAGTRVAVFGDQWIYPAFGARHDLVPIRLDRDGRLATRAIGDAMEPGELTVDPATFRANLRHSGVRVVVVLRQPHPGRAGERPSQEIALQTLADARLLHRDRATTIFALEP
jgi:hypothetical protein